MLIRIQFCYYVTVLCQCFTNLTLLVSKVSILNFFFIIIVVIFFSQL